MRGKRNVWPRLSDMLRSTRFRIPPKSSRLGRIGVIPLSIREVTVIGM